MALLSFLRMTSGLTASEPSAAAHELAIGPGGADLIDNPSRQLIRERRYAHVLSVDSREYLPDATLAAAWQALEREMALVPSGEVRLTVGLDDPESVAGDGAVAWQSVAVQAAYLDRHAVTNREFARFVAAGGYSRTELWPPEILAYLLQFADSTGCPGPRFWSHGRPPEKKLDHPVVGVCWFEANAYAQWTGKRLPAPAEWQRAGSWHSAEGPSNGESRYPWGNAFDPSRANTWRGGPGGTVPVDQYASGATANGILQLVGNVWEWVHGIFEYEGPDQGMRFVVQEPMAEIRGGAFDTYFPTQASCQFRSGQSFLHRGPNVGFRCCVSVDRLRPAPDPSAFLE